MSQTQRFFYSIYFKNITNIIFNICNNYKIRQLKLKLQERKQFCFLENLVGIIMLPRCEIGLQSRRHYSKPRSRTRAYVFRNPF